MFAEFEPATKAMKLSAIWRVRDMAFGLVWLVVSLGVVTVVLIAVSLGVDDGSGRADVIAALATLGWELMFGGFVVAFAFRRGLRWTELGFVRPRRWGPAVIAWLGAYAIILTYQSLLLLLEAMGINVSAFDQGNALPFDPNESAQLLVLLAVTVILVAPVSEELFFRALLFRGMRGYWGFVPSLAMSGFAFGFFHVNPSVILPFTGIGALFAWANEQSGSLWTSIAAHTAVNGASFALSVAMMDT